MTVQSARVQEIVKGDDVVLTHQIMEDVAYNAELSRAPVSLASGDTVNFFYPLEDSTVTDLAGYPGAPVGSYPTSQFTVPIPGLVIDPAGSAPNRGTSTFQSGPARTVRAEIIRLVVSVTGDTANDSDVLSNVSDVSSVLIGQLITGAGIPARTYVIAVSGSSVTMSQKATASATGVSLAFGKKETHYSIQEVDIFERGFPSSLDDTSGGANPPSPSLNLT